MNDARSRFGDSLERRDRVDVVSDRFERQWRAGESPRIEDYLERFPAKQRGELLEELIAVEVQLRLSGGDTVSVGQYQARFTDQADRIRRRRRAKNNFHRPLAPRFEWRMRLSLE